MTKSTILHALDVFASQRPGLEFANYGDISAYLSESRRITKDLHHFRTLLAAVACRDSITADDILKACESAYSGRLSIVQNGDNIYIDYCTGQYFPTEYRRAACAILASVLWKYFREPGMDYEEVKRAFRANVGRSITQAYC